MDGNMPIKTGWEATREIRQAEKERAAAAAAAGSGGSLPLGLIIIGVTGGTLSAETQKCLDSGMTDVVTKPVSPMRWSNGLVKCGGCAVSTGRRCAGHDWLHCVVSDQEGEGVRG